MPWEDELSAGQPGQGVNGARPMPQDGDGGMSMPEGGWRGNDAAEVSQAVEAANMPRTGRGSPQEAADNARMRAEFADQFQPHQQVSANDAAGQDVNRFTKSSIWRVSLPAAGETVCYDFDTASEVPGCAGGRWDIRLTGGNPVLLSTNSGSVGNGRAGVYQPDGARHVAQMGSWRHLAAWKSATRNPRTDQRVADNRFVSDVNGGAFSGLNPIRSAVYEYGLGGAGDQRLYPSHRVFLITSDTREASIEGSERSPVYALQVIGYYGDSGKDAGHIQLRWVDRREPSNLRQATVDASRDWVYVNLQTGFTSSLDDGQWHIAFNRQDVRLRGGDFARGRVGGMVGFTSENYYDIEGRPRADALMNALPGDSLNDLTSVAIAGDGGDWKQDRARSTLSPLMIVQDDDSRDHGWYTEYPTADLASMAGLAATAGLRKARDDRGMLVRSAEGNSYARFRLTQIDYQDASDSRSPQTWTFAFDVQPAIGN